MFSFSDVKMMYDWGCFTNEQVMVFVPLCITEEKADKIISKEERILIDVLFILIQGVVT
ncbi:XkdX family protein [Enterococcus sp. 079]|nr:XkdX family protein [Enterococcus sp. 079]